ncbi:MAG: hypothetical protein AABY83_08535 [Pseudomonadota bacterium]
MEKSIDNTVDINKLLVIFQSALRSLLSYAEELNIPWREPENYHDWDVVAEGVYAGFVSSIISNNLEERGKFPLIRYDQRVSNYVGLSFVGMEISKKVCPFVCLETTLVPFDTCLMAEIDSEAEFVRYVRIPFSESCFVVAAVDKDMLDILTKVNM